MTKLYTTTIRAINKDGELRSFVGPSIPAKSLEEAQEFCESNGLGYCKVDGMVPMDHLDHFPDVTKMVGPNN